MPEKEEVTPELIPEKYKGLDVLTNVLKITNTGDGLSKAMAIEPVEVEFGDIVYVALRLVKTKDGYDVLYSKDDEERPIGVAYVQQFKATEAAFVPARTVRKLIDTMHDKIIAAEEERKSGQGSLDMEYEDGDDLDADELPPNAAARRKEIKLATEVDE